MSHADDCAAVLEHLIARGATSLDDLADAMHWSRRTTNDVLCDLALKGQIGSFLAREKHGKVTKYDLKERVPR